MGLEGYLVGEQTKVLSFSDIQQGLGRTDGGHGEVRVGSIVIELPQRENGGALMAWEDLEAIREWCLQRGVWMHCDGARIWGAQMSYSKTLAQIADMFDR
jgi:threonine aldolase